MKRNSIKVSVGVVTYNSSNDIEKCLGSLIKHTNKKSIELSIYLYDNNSNDIKATQKIVADKYPFVKIITSKQNKGFGYGHNKIIDEIKSDYHLILNPDIEFTQDTIQKLIEYLESNINIALITPEIRNTDKTIQQLPKIFPKIRYVLSSTIPILAKYRTPYTMSEKTLTQPTNIQICTGCFMLARTNKLKSIGGFDENFFLYFEDFDLSMRMKKMGDIVYYPLANVTHVWHRDTKTSLKPFLLQVESMLKFYRKWGISGRKSNDKK